MTEQEFKAITHEGNFVAWQNESEPETTAIAYMSDNAEFYVAINCVRDSQMGEKDADGVYPRTWFSDDVYIEENPRLATEKEILLYLYKVGGLKECMELSDEQFDSFHPVVNGSSVLYLYDNTSLVSIKEKRVQELETAIRRKNLAYDMDRYLTKYYYLTRITDSFNEAFVEFAALATRTSIMVQNSDNAELVKLGSSIIQNAITIATKFESKRRYSQSQCEETHGDYKRSKEAYESEFGSTSGICPDPTGDSNKPNPAEDKVGS